ncbi:MAG TPA: oxaloacetate decarboxylase [Pseudohongiella sp.]|nr:oxaloacetate decarboxylase [Pseudohongiella sp.]|tara:strand:- start:56131 stop:56406 length:276 start_codon:yes stop_codon:yes gene_type:complete
MSDLMMEGLNLALYGMGFVFVFLIVLVGLTTAMSAIVVRYFPAPVASVPPRSGARKSARGSGSKASSNDEQQRVVAAISAAIRQHQNTRRG